MMIFLSHSAFGAAEDGGDAAGTSAEEPTLEELCERISAKRREIQAAEQRALSQEHRLTLQRELKELEEEINPKITITINGELLQPPPSRCSFTCLFRRNRKIKPVINIEYGQESEDLVTAVGALAFLASAADCDANKGTKKSVSFSPIEVQEFVFDKKEFPSRIKKSQSIVRPHSH